jgi:hypothetical protein
MSVDFYCYRTVYWSLLRVLRAVLETVGLFMLVCDELYCLILANFCLALKLCVSYKSSLV